MPKQRSACRAFRSSPSHGSICSGWHILVFVNHSCLTCRPGADRVIDYESNVVNLPQHFRGASNFGKWWCCYQSVRLSWRRFLQTDVAQLQVRLHQPVPLSTDLEFHEERLDNETVAVTIGVNGGTVLSGWASSKTNEPVMSQEHCFGAPTTRRLERGSEEEVRKLQRGVRSFQRSLRRVFCLWS